jgi:Asp-tRNA(Asn)/Glu-tRNA(Gln) amidotransferase A subunit family amidase
VLERISPLTALRRALAEGTTSPRTIASACAARANSSASHNTYLHFGRERLLQDAAMLENAGSPSAPLFGVPVSLKDCFDLAGTVTTCGSRFYAEHNQPAASDSAMVQVLRASGALITGKTHLQQLAYGITGQNPDFGDCLQPRDAMLLTGGSSAGAAASVQEGSALVAIGTDTGGSIRVPAALCGLTGYRASHGLAYGDGPWPAAPEGLWQGSVHLAETFDTPGFLLRDPRDAAPVAGALFGVAPPGFSRQLRIGFVEESWLPDARPEVIDAYRSWRRQLTSFHGAPGAFDPDFWSDAREIFAAIQAAEAFRIHGAHLDQFEPAIAQRLQTGSALSAASLAEFRARLTVFRSGMQELFARFDILMLPCAPASRLEAAADQSHTRAAILRYTTPFSLAGCPVVSLPGEIIGAPFGTGVQLAAAPGEDALLLAFAGDLAQWLIDQEGLR